MGEISEDDEALAYQVQRVRRKSRGDSMDDIPRLQNAKKRIALIRELSDLFALDSGALSMLTSETATVSYQNDTISLLFSLCGFCCFVVLSKSYFHRLS